VADFDATARVRVDLGQFTSAAREAAQSGGAWDTSLRSLQTSLGNVEAVEKKKAASLSATLRLYQQLTSSVAAYATATDKLARSSATAAQSSQNFNTALEQMGRSLSSVQGMSDKEASALRNTLGLYQQMAGAVNTYSASLRTMNSLTAQAGQSGTQLQNQMTQMAQASDAKAQADTRAAAGMAETIEHTMALRYAMYDLVGVYQQSAQALVAWPVAAVQAAREYEVAFAQVQRTTDATDAQLGELRQGLMDMGTEIPLAFEDISEIASFGSQMGIAAGDLEGFTGVVAEFAATTNVTAEQASKSFGRISNLLGVLPADYRNLASSVSELGDNSAATETDILGVAEQIAAAANQAGLSTQSVLGLSSALASLRVAPEAARGSTERIFADIDNAVMGVNDNLAIYARVMDMTVQETAKLWETNPDEFFMRFIQGLEGVRDAGGSASQVMTELGMANVRDINMVSRLSGNYQLLADSMNTAYTSYAQGTYLGEESAVVFNTLDASITRMINAMRNFAAGVGQGFVPVLTLLVNGVTELITLLDNPFVRALGAVVALISLGVAAFLGFRIALATTMAAMLALQFVTAQTASIGGVSLRGLGVLAAQTFGTMSTGATTAGAAMGAMGAQTAAGTAAAATGMRGATVGAIGLRAAISAIPGWGWALAGVSAVAALAMSWDELTGSATDASTKISDSAEALTQAGGGVEGLRQAVATDTAAWRDTGEAIRVIGENSSGAAGGLSEAEQAAQAAQGRLNELGQSMGVAAGESSNMDTASRTAQGGLYAAADGFRVAGEASEEAANRYTGSAAALGSATQDWITQAVLASDEIKAITEDEELYNSFRDMGIDLNEAIAAGLEEEGGATENLRQQLEEAGVSASESSSKMRQFGEMLRQLVPYGTSAGMEANDLAMEIEALGGAIDGQANQVTGAQRANELLGTSMADTGAAGAGAAGGLDAAGSAADAMGDQMQQAQADADALRGALTGFGSATDAWRNAQDAANRRRDGGGGGGGSTSRERTPSGRELDNGAVEAAKKQYDAVRKWAQAQEKAVVDAARRQHEQTVKQAQAQQEAVVKAAEKQHDALVKAMRDYEKQMADAETAAEEQLRAAEETQREAEQLAEESARAEEDAAERKENANKQLEAAIASRQAAELGLANADPQNQVQWQRALEAAIRNEAAAREKAAAAAAEHGKAQNAVTESQKAAEQASKAVLQLTEALEKAQANSAKAQELSAQRQEQSAERLASIQEAAALKSEQIQERSAARLEQIQAQAAATREARETAAQQRYEAAQERRRVLEDEARAATEANNQAASASTAQFAEDATFSLDQYLVELAKIVEAQHNWVTNMLELAGRLPPGVAMELAKLGPEAAPLVQQLVDGTDAQLQTFSGLFMQTTDDGVQGMVDILQGGIPLAEGTAGDMGEQLVYRFLEEMRAGERPVEEIVADYAEEINSLEDVNPVSTADIDTRRGQLALEQQQRALDEADGREIDATADFETGSFWRKWSNFWNALFDNADDLFGWLRRNFRESLGVVAGYADGGWIGGQGGPRQDNILIAASKDEFMVNAHSARKYAGVLEAINNDQLGQYVRGGSAGVSGQAQAWENAQQIQNSASLQARIPDFAASAVRRGPEGGPRIVYDITITNNHPQAEPTSVTTNRVLQYAANLGELG